MLVHPAWSYDGPVWAAHRAAANAMMLDSDDVLLLEAAPSSPPLDDRALSWPAPGAATASGGLVLIDITPVGPGDTSRFLDHYRSAVVPVLHAAGSEPLAQLRTLHAVNNFPRLPVREGEHVVVTVTRAADPNTGEAVAADPTYRAAAAGLGELATAPPQRLRVAPTALRAALSERPARGGCPLTAATSSSPESDGRHDFDFIYGN